MYTKNIKNTLFKVICVALLFAMLVPTNTALAATPSPVSALYAYGYVSDIGANEPVEDPIKLVSSSKSLWFSDGSSAVNVIKTHDTHGAIKHTGDSVQISVWQIGEGGTSKYTMLNGKRMYVPQNSTVVSAYPYQFKESIVYTVDRSTADPDTNCTILTVGHIGPTPTGTPYTRYETNVYIYWS